MEPDQFSLDDANALVPWLVESFRNINMIRQDYEAIQKRISDSHASSDNSIDSAVLKTTAEQLARQIEEGVEEILDQGIIVRDVSSGLVDFPSLRDNRDIYLCWIGGEERIGYWHETDQGFSSRLPL